MDSPQLNKDRPRLALEPLEPRIVLSAIPGPAALLAEPVIDDGDAAYTDDGWASGTLAGAYDGDYRTEDAGDGSESATWTFTGVDPGTYDVFVTWTAFGNRATDAPFAVYDGASLEETVLVNQQYGPDDEEEFGHYWERLGRYQISGGTLTVELTDDADGYVIADAVRVEQVDPGGDRFEDNDTHQEAHDLGQVADTIEEADLSIHEAGDVDWFTFALTETGNANSAIDVLFSHANGDIDIRLYEDPDFSPIRSSSSVSDNEAISLDGLPAGSYYLEVFSWGVATNMYDLRIVPPTGFVETVIDDGETGHAEDGFWQAGSLAGSYDGDYRASPAGDGSATATWTFGGLSGGYYEVYATWVPWSNRAANAPFTIYDGAAQVATCSMNQQLAPNDLEKDGSSWERLGIYRIENGTLAVELSNDADDWVIADAIWVNEATVAELLIDDGQRGYAETGQNWGFGALSGAYDWDYRWHNAGSGANSARWTFDGLQSGTYEVFATWREFTNRATDASYSILDGGSSEADVQVNQQSQPNDEQTSGSWWESLGSYDIDSGILTVELSDDADGIVIADAIRIVRTA